jgi:hypothetical protein
LSKVVSLSKVVALSKVATFGHFRGAPFWVPAILANVAVAGVVPVVNFWSTGNDF